jgi:hypothetical protein
MDAADPARLAAFAYRFYSPASHAALAVAIVASMNHLKAVLRTI